jgi:hypothetical protein
MVELAKGMDNNINLVELLNLYRNQLETINTFWNFLAVVALGLLGYVYKDEAMRKDWKTKLGLSIGFVVFAIANLGALHRGIGIAAELARVIQGRATSVSSEYTQLLKAHTYFDPWEVFLFHGLLDLMILLAVWLPNIVEWRRGRRGAAAGDAV